MSVVIETTAGDITVDLFLKDRPRACLNFLKLCKIKYYNYNLFHTISRGFIAQTGDPTGSRKGGESMYGVLDGPLKRYFESEKEPRIKHTKMGLVSFVGNNEGMIGSQFFFTLGEDLNYLDGKHCVFGEVVEGFEVLEQINEAICDTDDRPYQDIRITHTVILDDPFPDPKRLNVPERSPSPSAERLQGGRIAPDEEIDEMEGKSAQEIAEMQAEREAKARATILEMVGDLPDAEMAPPENVLFVCKLNPVTTDDDLEIIFSRFGKINSCEVIRDRKSGESLQYAFVEFDDKAACEQAYFKMDNVLIDDRRIHVDFSQSVSKVKWLGKGRGVAHFNDKGERTKENGNDVGKGNYKIKNGGRSWQGNEQRKREENRRGNEYRNSSKSYRRSVSPRRDRGKYSERRRHDSRDNRSRRYDNYRSRSPRYEDERNKDRYDSRTDRYKYRDEKYSGNRNDKVSRDDRRTERKRYSNDSDRDRSRNKDVKTNKSLRRDRSQSSDCESDRESKKKRKKSKKKVESSDSSSDSDRKKSKKGKKKQDSSDESDSEPRKKKKSKKHKKHSDSVSSDESDESSKEKKKSHKDKEYKRNKKSGR